MRKDSTTTFRGVLLRRSVIVGTQEKLHALLKSTLKWIDWLDSSYSHRNLDRRYIGYIRNSFIIINTERVAFSY
jgi:hypothetical protein